MGGIAWDSLPIVLEWEIDEDLWTGECPCGGGSCTETENVGAAFDGKSWHVSRVSGVVRDEGLAQEIALCDDTPVSDDGRVNYVFSFGGGRRIQLRPGLPLVLFYSGGPEQQWVPSANELQIMQYRIRLLIPEDVLAEKAAYLTAGNSFQVELSVAFRGIDPTEHVGYPETGLLVRQLDSD